MRPFVTALIALLLVPAVCGPVAGLAAPSDAPAPHAVRPNAAESVSTTVPDARPGDLDAGRAGSPLASRSPGADARIGDPGPNLTRPDPALVMTVNLTASGDAEWTVASRFNVSDENDTAAFRAFADTLGEGNANSRLGYSADTFRRFATIVEESTNRSDSMEITDVNWSSRIDDGTGVVALSFTWTNFARTEDRRVILDDVFAAGNGTWLRSLNDDQRLVIHSPPNYGVESSRFPTKRIGTNDSTIVRISLDGPRDLQTSDTPIVYAPIDDPPTSSTTTTPREEDPLGSWLLGGGFVLLVLAIVAGLVFYSRRVPLTTGEGTAGEYADAPGQQGTTDGGEAAVDAGDEPRPTGDDGDPQDAASGPSESGATGAAAAAGEDDVDVELLSDEERVERLLERNGGRMKQASIVKETGWSNAKVSQLLSSMDDDDRIDKLRIGRENLITLPDEDVGEID